MDKSIWLTRIALAVIYTVSVCYSFQTSSESANPFNQFASPSGGVNMYGGDVAYSHAVCVVTGRNGLKMLLFQQGSVLEMRRVDFQLVQV